MFAQDPSSGQFVDEGATVDLIISGGEDIRTVPQLIGLSREAAIASLRDRNYIVDVKEDLHDEVDEGVVFDQDPAVDTELATGETVTIWVSLGPPPTAVPEVAGQDPDAAIAVLVDAGFTNIGGTVPEPSSTVDEGKVTRTNPPAGEVVDPGLVVTVFVSSGVPVGTVPAVTGLLADAAIATIGASGFTADAAFDPLPPNDPNVGLVISQSPPADTQLALGGVVSIVVGSPQGPPPTQPPPTQPPPTQPPTTTAAPP